jgi:hypothetical protein
MPERRQSSAPTRCVAPRRAPRIRHALACVEIAFFALLAAGPAFVAGCGGRGERGSSLAAGVAAEWSWLQNAKRQLDDMRAQLAAVGAKGATGANEVNGAGEAPEPAGRPGDGPSPRERLQRQIDTLSRELDRRLVAYINADPPLEGAPLSPKQLAATRMKSDEEIAVAHQFIARSGDYRRAIEIYEAALAADPQNERLREDLARAREERFMTAARFSRAAPGMTAQQVRAALGQPNAHDVRGYADKGVVGWFYPRDPSGAAAGVWFQQQGGQLAVYLCDWNALPPAPASPQPTMPAGLAGPSSSPRLPG